MDYQETVRSRDRIFFSPIQFLSPLRDLLIPLSYLCCAAALFAKIMYCETESVHANKILIIKKKGHSRSNYHRLSFTRAHFKVLDKTMLFSEAAVLPKNQVYLLVNKSI